jgi:FeS assembly SUF system protein
MDSKPQRIALETAGPPAPPPAPASAAPPGTNPPAADLKPEQQEAMQEQVIAALRTCFDPEVPVNIYELGLIYHVEVTPAGVVNIRMTLTSPACPVAGSLPPEVRDKVAAIPGVTAANVELVWDPPWTQDRMTEAAKLQLGFF